MSKINGFYRLNIISIYMWIKKQTNINIFFYPWFELNYLRSPSLYREEIVSFSQWIQFFICEVGNWKVAKINLSRWFSRTEKYISKLVNLYSKISLSFYKNTSKIPVSELCSQEPSNDVLEWLAKASNPMSTHIFSLKISLKGFTVNWGSFIV